MSTSVDHSLEFLNLDSRVKGGGGAPTVWQWQDDRGSWHDYDGVQSDRLESAYSDSAAGLDLGGQHGWLIHFDTMEQENSSNGTRRKVQRIFDIGQSRSPIRYAVGDRVEYNSVSTVTDRASLAY